MLNLCSFPVTVAGVTLNPALHAAATFRPVVTSALNPAYPTLLGFQASFSMIRPPAKGSDVLIPRFAPWIEWALKHEFTPHCLPFTNGRQADGSVVCEELDPAPADMALAYPSNEYAVIPLPLDELRIFRMLPGSSIIELAGRHPSLHPMIPSLQAFRHPDNTVHVPDACLDLNDALLVPQDGAVIAAVARAYPDHGILVADQPVPGKRTVLFQVR